MSDVILETTGSQVILEVVDEGQVEVVELFVQGQQGPMGATGVQGPVGATGPLPYNYQGAWDNFANYALYDAVTHQGSLYWLPATGGWTVGGAPPGYNWELLVSAGATGPQGATGATGASHFADLLDVNVTGKVDNSVVYYDETTNKFLADDINTVVTLTDGGNF